MSQNNGAHPLMTREEAAVYLRISTTTLDRHVKSGVIKSVKIGKRVLFSREQLTGTETYSQTLNPVA